MLAEIIVDVLNNDVDKCFDYIALNNTLPGMRVKVPFGARIVDGYVTKLKDENLATVGVSKLKQVIKNIDETPIILDEQLKLMEFMANKFFLRKIDILRLFLPPELRKGVVKTLEKITVNTLNKNEYIKELETVRKNAKNKILLLRFLIENEGAHNLTDLNKQFSSSAVKDLIDKKLLKCETAIVQRSPFFIEEEAVLKVKLTAEQEIAVKKIINANNKTFLLHGVTGSGKTEIYLNVIENCLNNGKTAIMLVPEISLTPQIFSRFKGRFGEKVAIIHSGLSQGERFDEWTKIKNGEAKIVVGARSAIFTPVKNVGVIIMDEEHDSSYFSESNPRFDAHEIALFRSNYNKCPLVLGSATPDIASYFKTKTGEFELISILKRVNEISLPEIKIVNMCDEIRHGNNGIFSALFLEKLEQCIKNKKQAMVFINRRGYSSFLRCIECGYIPKCTDCDVSLVYHKEEGQLKCHFCGKKFKTVDKCGNCGNEHLRFGGVGTERIVNEIKELYPLLKVLRMDNDTVQGKNSHIQILNEFKNTAPAVLVGTQMIAKGHDFPNVNLVGIVDADLSLHFSDFRSNERTFQLITQVAGRAGRAYGDGLVVLQTYTPRHFVYKYAVSHSYINFYDKDINIREVTKFPPFAVILRVLVSSEDEKLAIFKTKRIYDKLKLIKENFAENFIYLDAHKAPVKKIQNKFRFQVLMRFKNKEKDDIIKEINNAVKSEYKKGVNIFVEVNPQNLS